MKTHPLFLLFCCMLTCQLGFSQLPEFIVPQYYVAGNGNVNSLSGISTSNATATVNYAFDNTNYSNFQHTAQNAWYENGRLLFYVISGIDNSNGSPLYQTMIYNNKGQVIDVVYKCALNEIGIVKVGCTSYHLLIGVTLFYLTLEPCLGKSNLGGAYEIFDLDFAGVPVACSNIHPGGSATASFTSFAISKPHDGKYDIYYFGMYGFVGSSNHSYIFKQKINFLDTMRTYSTSKVALGGFNAFKLNNPFINSSLGEMELSSDETKLAFIDDNTVNVLEIQTRTLFTYNTASGYPNYSNYYGCTDFFPMQPCGLEFNEDADELAFTLHDVRGNSYWPSGKDAFVVWSSFDTKPAVINIVPGTAQYANSFIETGSDKHWYLLGPTSTGSSGSYGTYLKFDPTGNNLPTTGQFPHSSELNYFRFKCDRSVCLPGVPPVPTNNHFRTLPCQTDFLIYNANLQVYDCCEQYYSDFRNVRINSPEAFLSNYNVNENTVFDENRLMYRDIVVKKGFTLTIRNCTIRFKQTAKIVVEAGAKLIVDNATLTDLCGQLWPGIVVLGDDTKAHTTVNQGFVHLLNHAMVEHAVQAVLVKPKAIIFGVGSSIIRNCLKGVAFEATTNVPDNVSFFQEMIFECTRILPGLTTGTQTFMEITGINMLGIYGCSFKNTASRNILNAYQRGTGVEIVNSSVGFHLAHCILNPNTNCFDQSGSATIFDKLTTGVFARNSEHIVIDQVEFTNCQSAVYFTGLKDAHILRSKFALSNNLSNQFYQIQPAPLVAFITDNNTEGLHILQNSFHWDNQSQLSYAGIFLSNMASNSFDNEIRNNTFQQSNRSVNTEIKGIYQDAKYSDLRVEWNAFNELTYGWYLEPTAAVNPQTDCQNGAECPDPMNSWVDANWSLMRIMNNSKNFNYLVAMINRSGKFDPEGGVTSLMVNVSYVNDMLKWIAITDCDMPLTDPFRGTNKPITIIDTYEDHVKINISPNPVHDGLLNYSILGLGLINEIEISNFEGFNVYHLTTNSLIGQIDLAELKLPKGIYCIRFISDSKSFYTKFYVE